MPGIVEIDQSGKIEFTGEDTALAFSNGKQWTILVPASVKRNLYKEFRSKGLSEKAVTIKLFSVCLYLLLKKNISSLSSIYIDQEYQGHEPNIKAQFTNLMKKAGISIDKYQIHFVRVGKASPAHVLALDVLRKRKKPNVILTEIQILSELSKRNRGNKKNRGPYIR